MTNLEPSKKNKQARTSKKIFTLMELKAIRRSVINSGNSRNIDILELLYSGARPHEITNSTTEELSLIFPEWQIAAGVAPKGRTLHNLRVSLAHQFAKLQTNISPAAIVALTKHHHTKQTYIHYAKSNNSTQIGYSFKKPT